MARRPKLTPELIDTICSYVRVGMKYKDAARAAGIGESTFYNWRVKGEHAKSGVYKEFVESLSEANAQAKLVLVSRVHKASENDWRAAMSILEHRWPQDWGRVVRNEISGAGGNDLVVRFVWEAADGVGGDGTDGSQND